MCTVKINAKKAISPGSRLHCVATKKGSSCLELYCLLRLTKENIQSGCFINQEKTRGKTKDSNDSSENMQKI